MARRTPRVATASAHRPSAFGPSAAFRKAFGADACRAMLPAPAFERGRVYAEEGRVRRLSIGADAVTATVDGSVPYEVSLRLVDGTPSPSCTCPIGQAGDVCKHVVAVALVSTGAAGDASSVEDPQAVRAYLLCLDRERLVDLVEQIAAEDDLLLARLRLDAARARASVDVAAINVSLASYRRTIDSALRVRGFVSYREMPTWARQAQSVIDSLRGLLDDGHAGAVVELADRALTLLERAAEHADDSDGHLRPLAEQVSRLHARACEQARVDPRKLAATLFARETGHGDELEAFYGAARTYLAALGDVGLAEYRRRASAAWDELPALRPGDEGRRFDHRRFRLAHVMETLAELSGDVDERVGVLAKDQSSPWQFVRIVEVLRGCERFADALEWAERGVAAFGIDTDPRLIDVLAEEYQRAGRASDAVGLLWRIFDADPDARSYRRLQAQAARAGLWKQLRDRAMVRLDDTVTGAIADTTATPARLAAAGRRGMRADATPLVDVLLWEGDAAWAEAARRGCSNALWLQLAEVRERSHPLDAIPIWQAEVERLIDTKRKDRYGAAVRLVEHVAELFRAGGRADDARAYGADLRARHRAKRSLMALLDRTSAGC